MVYLDSLLFMSELFGFMNLRHFFDTEDMKNNRSSELNILSRYFFLSFLENNLTKQQGASTKLPSELKGLNL